MLQLIVNQRDTVEAIDVFPPTVAIHPNARRLDDFSPFGARHRLERTSKGHSAPRLHLDEGDQMAAPGDEVELDAAYAKAVRDDVPTLRLEKTDGLLFTGQPALMAGICPIRWIAVNAARHGVKVASESLVPSSKIRVLDHYSTSSSSRCYPLVFTRHRKTSATLQAWAIQPRGVYGASASKISAIVPTPTSGKCAIKQFRKLRAPVRSSGCTLSHASMNGPTSHAQPVH